MVPTTAPQLWPLRFVDDALTGRRISMTHLRSRCRYFERSAATEMVMAALKLAVKDLLLFRRQNGIEILDSLGARGGLLLRDLQGCRHAVRAFGCGHGRNWRCFGRDRQRRLQL